MPPCGRCGDTILWHETKAGKMMPLDPGAHPEGNCIIEEGVIVVLGKDDPRRTDGSVILLRPHWATCRNPPKKGT